MYFLKLSPRFEDTHYASEKSDLFLVVRLLQRRLRQSGKSALELFVSVVGKRKIQHPIRRSPRDKVKRQLLYVIVGCESCH